MEIFNRILRNHKLSPENKVFWQTTQRLKHLEGTYYQSAALADSYEHIRGQVFEIVQRLGTSFELRVRGSFAVYVDESEIVLRCNCHRIEKRIES